MGTTTIQITDETKSLLDNHKQQSETYNDVVRRLAGATDAELWTEEEIRGIVREEVEAAQSRY